MGQCRLFGLEDERLRCILGHLPFAVDFTGYDDKLHIGVNILAKAVGIEESGIENIGVIFSGFPCQKRLHRRPEYRLQG